MDGTIIFRIEGMTCAACVARVEKALLRVPGVAAAEVSLATETARVVLASADPQTQSAAAAAIETAGYSATPRTLIVLQRARRTRHGARRCVSA